MYGACNTFMQYKNWQLLFGCNIFLEENTDSPFDKVFSGVTV